MDAFLKTGKLGASSADGSSTSGKDKSSDKKKAPKPWVEK